MKISVVSSILGGLSLEESLKYLSSLGVEQFELGVGGYPGKAHADALVLSKDEAARKALADTFKKPNVPLKDLKIKSQVLIACIVRNRHVLLPDGNEVILPKDNIVLVTTRSGLNDLNDILEGLV